MGSGSGTHRRRVFRLDLLEDKSVNVYGNLLKNILLCTVLIPSLIGSNSTNLFFSDVRCGRLVP